MGKYLNLQEDFNEVIETTDLKKTKKMPTTIEISIDEYRELISCKFKNEVLMQMLSRCFLSESEKAIFRALGGEIE